ncbi:bifunctional YncE family protein/alkaline phosphatase family protein [Actinocrinis puniceicyclus]|uniref:Bifunctional YncE family protein/alkaline phosphatase family protein n=1 Tax=Actinocrinis puniceicyclus TaxID=977794 RepID=A0A8J8BD35_9ACTN|nr:bifunctional YncE family protein/alkaline phosphatase family protein [Actinocrinis puniceicyclus]MBS2965782.1 bifunctional YncE family protein/alkaline phosphatase family protein [Actinocrinis puniceicyclus]
MQVTRRRRPLGKGLDLPGGRSGRRRLAKVGVASIALVLTGTTFGSASTQQFGTQQVPQITDKGQVLPSDQYINPIGDRLVINQGKIMASSVSPDGTHLAALVADGGVAMVIVDLRTWQVRQVIGKSTTADLKISGNDVGQAGPSYSPDGKTLWLGRADGYTRFTVNSDGTVANPVDVAIPAQGTERALSAQAVFSADGSTVYAAVNGQNRVVAIDAATGAIERSWNVGNAPRDMVVVGGKIYVGDEGGRTAVAGDSTLNSYGTQVPASQFTGSTTSGTVSVIDPANPAAAVANINVGLHPTALYAKGSTLFVANTNSDTVSIIDTAANRVVQTISTQPWPEAAIGYEPDAITLTGDGHLLVTLGRANAVAVYRYTSARQPVSYVGLLPTDYFPAEITSTGNQVLVANTRGIDALRTPAPYAAGHNTHDTTSSLQKFTLPDDHVIREYTKKVFQYDGWTKNSVKYATGRGDRRPTPVPQRIGDPSTIKHVFLIVKENRTYDQVFGDDPRGNGDPALTQFGAAVTPNQHAMEQQFGLYDNTYDVGTNSAEGHNWLMQADDPEYTESSAGEYQRSYDTEDDALGHQASGFLWTGAEAAGKSVRDFGEFQQFLTKPSDASWQNLYCDAKNMAATGATTAYPLLSSSPIPSLNDVSVPGYPKFDTSVPDIYREQIWQKDFQQHGPAGLNMFWLSSDHTGGPPNPAAQVADNDLAVGQIVDTISHSKYWKDSAIFVVEDDSQAGLDHVDGHRAPIQIISPWAQRGVVDDHYYSQITMVRTIEQILGIHPMNQLDAAATPMTGAFTSKPDYAPFNAVPNQTSLTLGLSTQPSCGSDTVASKFAALQPSTAVPAAEKQVAAQWQAWLAQQHTTGSNATPDYANPEQMNHLTWYQTSDWKKPYPGESRIYAPDQVPGAFIPSADSN